MKNNHGRGFQEFSAAGCDNLDLQGTYHELKTMRSAHVEHVTTTAMLLLFLAAAEEFENRSPAFQRVIELLDEFQASQSRGKYHDERRASLISRLNAAVAQLRVALD
jgi:hypothetical protein